MAALISNTPKYKDTSKNNYGGSGSYSIPASALETYINAIQDGELAQNNTINFRSYATDREQFNTRYTIHSPNYSISISNSGLESKLKYNLTPQTNKRLISYSLE